MRRSLVFAAVLLMLLPASLVLSDPSSAATGGLLIYEVDPVNEGFTIVNTSSSPVNLSGKEVTDGEGTLKFTGSFPIEPGASITFVSSVGEDWFTTRAGAVPYSASGITKTGSLTFANAGDEFILRVTDGGVIDSVCFGSSSGTDGWSGDPVPISSKRYLLRISMSDTDTAADWISSRPGWTNLEGMVNTYEADVTPFTFPESQGTPVLKALASADTSIYLSIYLVSSRNAVALLESKAAAGVDVRILVEGNPLGVDTMSELKMLKSVVDSGGDVRIINGGENTRYSYVHNKYAVIDGDTTVITSENWTTGNIGTSGNRGWGAVIESTGYAAYMTAVFENDFDKSYGDVVSLTDAYPYIPSDKPYYNEPDAYSTTTYHATVTPVLSPDNSYSSLRTFMSGATSRVYAQQMDLGSNLSSSTGDTPISWMATAAGNGLDVKFILDSSQSKEEHEKYVSEINYSTSVKAIAVDGRDGFSLIHNKGVIVDDSVWVGSVNWTTNSFGNNRETAVIIHSADVTSYFLDFFMGDWGMTIDEVRGKGLSFKVDCRDTKAGSIVEMSIRGPEGYSYRFELGDGTVRTTDSWHVVFDAPSAPGKYTARVTVEGTDISEEFEYTVEDGSVSWIIYAVAACLVLAGTAAAVLRGNRNARRRGKHGGRGPRHASGRR